MDDCLILGGGVVGLSLAYELARHGQRVHVVDRGAPGQEASWAGAGILPPANRATASTVDDELLGFANELHAEWSERLLGETHIDNELWRCGAVYLARDADTAAELADSTRAWLAQGIDVRPISGDSLREIEPVLADDHRAPPLLAAAFVPGEAQLRNPRHLQALVAACARLEVRISPQTAVEGFELRGGRVEAVCTATGKLSAKSVCVTGGAWSRELLTQLGHDLPIKPIRGQIALLNCGTLGLRHIVNEGPRYLVPRRDGRVLVGSTVEDVGFDKRSTAEAIGDLLRFATELAPALGQATLERSWAGLRPHTRDGRPYLGRVPGLENTFVAAGHFRSGLQLSPATAVLVGQLIRGLEPAIDLSAFRVDRPVAPGLN